MVLHTFHLRFKTGTSEEQIDRALAEIQGFQGQVPGLLETYVGHNFSARSNGFTVGAVMIFVDRAALEDYIPSAVHGALLEWLVPLIESAQDVDFDPLTS